MENEEKNDSSTGRRSFFRKLVAVAAATGISGLLLGKLAEPVRASNIIPGSGKATFDGPVGIATTSPETLLHVSGSATADVFCGLGPHPNMLINGQYLGPAMNYGYSGHSFGEGSGFFNVRPDAAAVAPNPSLRFMTNNTQRMIIDNNGNVGIGTTSPALPLTVFGTLADPATSGTTPAGMIAITQTGGVAGYMGIAASAPHGLWLQSARSDSLETTFPILLNPNGGFVGIGTTNPTGQLEIVAPGGANLSNGLRLTNNSGPQTFEVQAGMQSVANTGFSIVDITHSNAIRLFIAENGEVGIGTTNPDQALSVFGNADKSSGGTAWGTFSDRRWKDEASIEPFTPGLDWVRSLPAPVRFHYAKDNGIGANPDEVNVNFIAQDLLDGVHDRLVYLTKAKIRRTDKQPAEAYGVNVNDMHFAMVNAIKELAEQNQALREEVRLLKSRLDASEENIKLAAS